MRAFPEEFRRDVVKVTRDRKEPRNKNAADFGVSRQRCPTGCAKQTSTMVVWTGSRENKPKTCGNFVAATDAWSKKTKCSVALPRICLQRT